MRRIAIILSTVYLGMTALSAVFIPGGFWGVSFFGGELFAHNDPDGAYLASSIHFFGPGSYPPFFGHPGLTLQVVVHGFAKIAYLLAEGINSPVEFSLFAAKNLKFMYVLGAMASGIFFLGSFFLCYALIRQAGGGRVAAYGATLALATSFPILMYSGKISPEPYMLFFSLLGLFWFFCLIVRVSQPGPRTVLLAVACGGAMALACLSKVHLAFAPTIVLPAYVLLGLRTRANLSWRLKILACYSFGAVTMLAVGAVFMDLRAFAKEWLAFINFFCVLVDSNHQEAFARYELLGILKTLAYRLFKNIDIYFAPFTMSRESLGYSAPLIMMSEFVFAVISTFGFFLAWNRKRARDHVYIFICILLVLFCVQIFRVSFHYWFYNFFIMAFFFSVFIQEAEIVVASKSFKWRLIASSCVVAFMHFGVICMFFDMNRTNLISSEKIMVLYRALNRIEYGQRIAFVPKGSFSDRISNFHGLGPGWGVDYSTPVLRNVVDFFYHVTKESDLNKDVVFNNNIALVLVEGNESIYMKLPDQ